MFSDRYGLTQSVLEGRKTQTRRIVRCPKTFGGKYVSGFRILTNQQGIQFVYLVDEDECEIEGSANNFSAYDIGEEIAVAMSYEAMANSGGQVLASMMQDETTFKQEYCGAGWKNKMFVQSTLMPHRIKITNIRVERLQDISNEDCIAEGIEKIKVHDIDAICDAYRHEGCDRYFWVAREAYASLIDNVSGKGTWASNPYVFVYDFKLIR